MHQTSTLFFFHNCRNHLTSWEVNHDTSCWNLSLQQWCLNSRRYLGTVHLFFWLCSPLPFLIGQLLCIPRCISHTYLFDSSTLEACLRWRIRAVFIGLGGEKIKVRQDRGILIAVSGLQVSRQYSRGQDVVMYSFFLVLVLPLSRSLSISHPPVCAPGWFDILSRSPLFITPVLHFSRRDSAQL